MQGASPAVVGGYELAELVARGPASEVWRGRRTDGAQGDVAVKRARRDGVATLGRLRAEAELLADLELPNVVRVLEIVPDGADVAIVMELAPGGSLEDLLRRRGRLPAGQVVALVAPVALALGEAHRRGVVHGDIKPANVLLGFGGDPLLTDFGTARPTGPALGDLHGSAAYLDPQLLATGRSGAANDVYALGVLTYLALTGRLPHTGRTAQEVLDAAARGAHPSLTARADVPPLLAGAVEAALARDVDRRPPSAEYFAATLRAAVDPATVVLPAGSPAGRAPVAAPAPIVTRPFGPQPLRPLPDPEPTPGRRLALVGVVIGAVLLAASGSAVAALVWGRGGPTVQPTAAAVLGRASARACPRVARIPVPASARELSADLSGDGCPEQIVWDGAVMRFRIDAEERVPRQYDFAALGEGHRPGALLVGDWDCDGAESPAFYDPDSGVVHYFAAVPRRGALTAASLDDTGISDGVAGVQRSRAGACDRVVVRP